MTIAIGSDHAGYALKEAVKTYLEEKGVAIEDFGTHNADSVDYVSYAKAVCGAVKSGSCEKGLLFCGTGIGMSMAANKIHGIRAAACSDYFSAKATRQHNDANVLCLGERVVGPGLAFALVDVFLETAYEGGERHIRRLNQVMELENDY